MIEKDAEPAIRSPVNQDTEFLFLLQGTHMALAKSLSL